MRRVHHAHLGIEAILRVKADEPVSTLRNESRLQQISYQINMQNASLGTQACDLHRALAGANV
jgi:hypothetical protein